MKGKGKKREFVTDLIKQPKYRHGLHIDLSKINRNTREGRALHQIKTALRGWVGEGTPGTELLIQRIAYKSLRLAMYEASKYRNPDLNESSSYLAMTNSLRVDLCSLEQLAQKKLAPTLDDFLIKDVL